MPEPHESSLLDTLDMLLQLPRNQRQPRLLGLGLSDQDRAKLETWLRHHDSSSGFLEDAPPLARDGMQLLVGAQHGPPLSSRELEAQAPPKVAGYEVYDLLGQGGMASVWRAKQLATGRTVALKVMSPLEGASRRSRGRFERELRLLSRLQHPHIARVYDAGFSGGLYYFAMELVEGKPLDQFVRSQNLNHRQMAELMKVVCEAVTHAHRNGVIHRDLKPSNILVTADGQPHVLDFGLAKALEEAGPEISVSLDGDLAGTPAYMSPEQAAGSPALDTRSDVYSLGVILYGLLTGQPAHDLSGSRLEVLKRISRQDVRRPRELCKQIDADLEAVLLKALEREPDRRYGSAAELAQDLGRYLADEPVEAATPSRFYRFRKLLRRHKREAAAVAAIVAALLLGIAGLTVGLLRAHRAQTAAQNHARKAEAVSQFVRAILAGARPGLGADVKVLDLLKLASARVARDLTEQPEAEIEVRQTLADTYHGLGHSVEAEPEARRAYELSLQLDHGTVSPRTLRAATKLVRQWISLKDWADPCTQQLARQTYAAARQTLGEDDPITQVAAQALAVALTFQGKPSQAEPIWRRLVAQMAQQKSDYALDPSFNLGRRLPGLASSLHNQGIGDDTVIRQLRETLRQMKTQKERDPDNVSATWMALALMLADKGLEDESLGAMHEAVTDTLQKLRVIHVNAQWTVFVYAAALQRSGRWEAAADVLRENLRLIRAEQPAESQILACALVQAGMIDVGRHRKEGIAAALEGFDMTRRVGPLSDSDQCISYADALRQTLLAKLGSWDRGPDGKLGAQAYCALEELFRESQSQLLDLAAATPADVRYELRRWAGGSIMSAGTLADLTSAREPEPGLYALTLDAAGSGTTRFHQTHWLLFAPWEVTYYSRQGRTILPINLRPGYHGDVDLESGPWERRLAEKPEAAAETVNSLAFMTPLRASPAADGREEDFGLVARTDLELPAGRYRFIVTSSKGARLYVDGNRVIDAWGMHTTRRDAADLPLTAGRHELRLAYFQAGGSYKLWVRIEPLDGPGIANSTERGTHAGAGPKN